MTIKRIYLRDFRNYQEALVDFDPGVNVLVGDNAQGKTNLLEAIGLLMTGRSFRTSHLQELIRFGASAFYLEALFEKNGVEQVLKFAFNGKERKIIHNATPLPSVSALLGILQGVILSPEDHALVKGTPQVRRHFIDLLMAQANPLYLHHLTRYWKALKQRNTLLKRRSIETITIWEEQMALSAAFLSCHRHRTVEELQALSQTETLGTDHITLTYRSSAITALGPDAEALHVHFLKQFEKHRKREIELGVTLSGPHRDDLAIFIEGKEAKLYASEGQVRGVAAALRLAQWKWLKALTETMPTLCIDDLGVSFDPHREDELYKKAQNLGQVFITTARTPSAAFYLIGVQNGHFVFEKEMDHCSQHH